MTIRKRLRLIFIKRRILRRRTEGSPDIRKVYPEGFLDFLRRSEISGLPLLWQSTRNYILQHTLTSNTLI